MDERTLSVRLHGIPVGELKQNDNGKLQFRYIKPFPENKESISYSLPLSMNERVFQEDECKPFFEGLLPENDADREVIARRYGVNARNTLGMLKAIGRENAGALSFHEINESIIENKNEAPDVEWKTDEEIELYLNQLPQNPLFNGIGDVRLSLAGIQRKACVYIEYDNRLDGRIGLPKRDTPSTHIIKPEITGFPNSAFNEWFCLELADDIGLEAAKASFRIIGKTPCVIVRRYDRKINKGKIERLHQEDFCQALGKLPTQKYENEGGPSIKDCFSLLRGVSPHLALDIMGLVDYVLFNFIVGNTDAHGKNFSLLYSPTLPRLAPLYDVLCCQIYDNHSQRMAMKIGGKYFAEDVFARHWGKFCGEISLSLPGFKGRAHELCEKISQSLPKIVPSLTVVGIQVEPETLEFAKKLQNVIQRNMDTLIKRLASPK
jgi:serine/threonine-protein kinase HipA